MNWRTMIEGAARWLTCDRLDDAAAGANADHCRGCPHLRIYRLPVLGHYYATCGPRLEETAETCGCVVLTAEGAEVGSEGDREAVRARFRAAATPTGKTTCRGEGCPRWIIPLARRTPPSPQ